MSLIDRYVTDLFDYASYASDEARLEDEARLFEGGDRVNVDKTRLQSFYTYATVVLHGSNTDSMPDELDSFLRLLSPEDTEAVLIKFVEAAHKRLGLLDVKIYSASQLNIAQRTKIEEKLVSIFGQEISMIIKVDPSLIGGLRVIVGNTVFDNTIKTRLADMKKNVYKEVYLRQ
ncbi:MAG: F0F1 ATP synthase subunit delta [Oscillospiraceae bacterium]|nr:F0F1 ATP synthase subunit delta [Oscillospiraceae bacterium]